MGEREPSSHINSDAAEWAVRADSEAFGIDEEAALATWLAGDVRRVGAYARARAMLTYAGRAKALGPTFDADAYASQHREVEHVRPEVFGEGEVRLSRRRFVIGGSATVAAGIAAAVGFSWQAAAATYSTARGEIRRVPLADGSSMTLNTETTAKVRFTRNERHVELVVGEALFDVVKDIARPFVVEAGASRVKGGMTSFTVSRLEGEPVKVTVRQGNVQVQRPGSLATSSVAANMRVVLPADTAALATQPVAPAEIARELAWQQGMLSFEDAPLSEAAAQFARYSDTAIRFDDPAIGNETITGLFAANNPKGFARSAALSLGLKSNERTGAITLSR